MNKKRREKLKEAMDYLGAALRIAERVKDEESDCYDNLPENFQYADRGEKMQDTIDLLDDAIDQLNTVYDKINDVALN